MSASWVWPAPDSEPRYASEPRPPAVEEEDKGNSRLRHSSTAPQTAASEMAVKLKRHL